MEKEMETGYDSDEDAAARPFEIQASDLAEDALDRLIKAFIVPDETDFGMTEAAYLTKERVVRKQIASGSLKIVSDPGSETTMLIGSQDWRKLNGSR